jgi:hypothetical protein
MPYNKKKSWKQFKFYSRLINLVFKIKIALLYVF